MNNLFVVTFVNDEVFLVECIQLLYLVLVRDLLVRVLLSGVALFLFYLKIMWLLILAAIRLIGIRYRLS